MDPWEALSKVKALRYSDLPDQAARDDAAVSRLMASGRLLVYCPDLNLWEGASQEASDGFFDGEDCPPWAAWVAYFEEGTKVGDGSRYLIAWVPRQFERSADEGIDVNSTVCVQWLDRTDLEIVGVFEQMGFLSRDVLFH